MNRCGAPSDHLAQRWKEDAVEAAQKKKLGTTCRRDEYVDVCQCEAAVSKLAER
jgi:hypothetical protein